MQIIPTKHLGCLSMVAACLATGSVFAADDDITYSVNLKLWQQKANAHESNLSYSSVGSVTSPILAVGARYKNYFVSLGHYVKKRATANGNLLSGGQRDISREETDIGFGWYFVPQVALTFSYKDTKYNISSGGGALTGTDMHFKATSIGLNAAIPFNQSFFGYGNASRSFQIRSTNNLGPGGGNGLNSNEGNYMTGELGVGYTFNKNTTFTVGYRAQEYNIENSITAPSLPGQMGKGTIKGIAGGMTYSF